MQSALNLLLYSHYYSPNHRGNKLNTAKDSPCSQSAHCTDCNASCVALYSLHWLQDGAQVVLHCTRSAWCCALIALQWSTLGIVLCTFYSLQQHREALSVVTTVVTLHYIHIAVLYTHCSGLHSAWSPPLVNSTGRPPLMPSGPPGGEDGQD